jgi:hypothetical protein
VLNHSSSLKIISERACIVYDSATGDVLHIHHLIAYEGGDVPSDDEMHASALEYHKTFAQGETRPQIETLIVDRAELSTAVPKIDTKAKRLIRA